VPGDYAFPIDDAVEAAPNVQWVAWSNDQFLWMSLGGAA
jgi:TPP-dependent 2-oxoacid decarboxylase